MDIKSYFGKTHISILHIDYYYLNLFTYYGLALTFLLLHFSKEIKKKLCVKNISLAYNKIIKIVEEKWPLKAKKKNVYEINVLSHIFNDNDLFCLEIRL